MFAVFPGSFSPGHSPLTRGGGGGGALQSLLGTTTDLKVNPHTQFSTLLSGEALKGKESPLLSSHSELPKILLFASKFFC